MKLYILVYIWEDLLEERMDWIKDWIFCDLSASAVREGPFLG